MRIRTKRNAHSGSPLLFRRKEFFGLDNRTARAFLFSLFPEASFYRFVSLEPIKYVDPTELYITQQYLPVY